MFNRKPFQKFNIFAVESTLNLQKRNEVKKYLNMWKLPLLVSVAGFIAH